ncbi:MAG: DEAD/DEAH box helicase [Elusimicrobia bacterium]|nr:DEAD/DEAH box helicase [Elusimicrobiota bacterium]
MKPFSDFNLREPLARALAEQGFTTPTPIQEQALPILLSDGSDFIGLAATGTGKTAAFAIPLLEKLDPHAKHVQALVLCPTRELALQVSGQIALLGKHLGIKAVTIYGGTGYKEQLDGLRHGAHVVVGTPGRVIDHLNRRSLDLRAAKTVVLDEADEMISMGFKEDLEKILQATQHRHIWLFSATMSREVRRVADTYLKAPKTAQVNRTEMLSSTVSQLYYIVRESDKPEVLCNILELTEGFYGLVFCQTKALVVDLTRYLLGRGFAADSLHGDKSQEERDRAMKAFRERKTTLLVCTDVASRGLDVKELTHVINYSIPRELELYVHRIGRTARSGKAGIAISLVAPATRGLVNRLEYMTKTRLTEGKVPGRREIAAKKLGTVLERFSGVKQFARAMDMLGPDWERAAGDMTLAEVIGRFLILMVPEAFEEKPKEKMLFTPHAAKPREHKPASGTHHRPAAHKPAHHPRAAHPHRKPWKSA